MSIIGKSGSGKSTLLNIIGGLDTQTSGQIDILSNKDIKGKQWDELRNYDIGFIFQAYNIFDDLTVLDNVALPLVLQGVNSEISNKKSLDVLKLLEMDDLADLYCNELSGGQKQRVAIARALVKNPKIILADEPTGNLDSDTGLVIIKELKKLSKDKLVIMVTHDKQLATKYSDRIIEIDKGIVKSDNKQVTNVVSKTDAQIDNRKINLPHRYIAKFTYNNLRRSYKKAVLTATLMLVSLVTIGFVYNFSNYNITDSIVTTLHNNGVTHTSLSKYERECQPSKLSALESCSLSMTDFQSDEVDRILSKYSNDSFNKYFSNNGFILDNYYVLDEISYYTNYSSRMNVITESTIGNQIILGDYPSEQNQVLVTDYMVDMFMYYNVISKEEEILEQDILTPDFGNFEISGVIETDYEKYDYLIGETNAEVLIYSGFVENREAWYSPIYIDENNFENLFDNLFRVRAYRGFDTPSGYSGYELFSYEYLYSEVFSDSGPHDLKDNEIIISTEFREVFGTSSDELVISFGDVDYTFKIVGEIDTDFYDIPYFNNAGPSVVINQNMLEEYYKSYKEFGITWTLSDSEYHDEALLKQLDKDYIFPKSTYTDDVFILDFNYSVYNNLFFAIFAVILVLSTVILYLNISSNIKNRAKEIGILRSIGARNIDLFKIYLAEVLISVVISLVIATFVLMIGIGLFNNYIYKVKGYYLSVISNTFAGNLVMLSFAVMIVVLTVALTMRRIAKVSPSEAIRIKE